MPYQKQTWTTGDTVTADKLNHIEDGIEQAGQGGSGEPSAYIKNAVVSNNGNTLTLTKKDNTTVAFTPSGGGSTVNHGWNGKVISILGDSISTYDGYTPVADGHNLTHRNRYAAAASFWHGTVNDTYWMKLINNLGAKLGINDSWAGSRVHNNSDTNSGDGGPDACMASTTRITNLGANGTPDLILYYGGTNDCGGSVTVGSFDSTVAHTVNTATKKWSTFADAYAESIMRLQYYYPFAKILVLLPTYCTSYYPMARLDSYIEQVKNICDYFGVEYIDLRRAGMNPNNISTTLGDGIHPQISGFAMIENYVRNKLLSMYTNDGVENVVHTITNTLPTGLVNNDRYIKGVSNGKAYSATIVASGSGDLTTVHVSMGGTDITSTAYNSGTGKITISSVTGAVLINTGAPQVISVTGVTLNKSSDEIGISATSALTATLAPANATDQVVTWSIESGNDKVSITPNGLNCTVTGVALGSAVVKVTTHDGSFTAQCAITVSNVAVTGVTVDSTKTILAGGTGTITAVIAPSGASNKNVTWAIQSGSEYISISGTGLTCTISGTAAGSAVVRVTTQDGSFTADCAVTVVSQSEDIWYSNVDKTGNNDVNIAGYGWSPYASVYSSAIGQPVNLVRFRTGLTSGSFECGICTNNGGESDLRNVQTVQFTSADISGGIVTIVLPQSITMQSGDRFVIYPNTQPSASVLLYGASGSGSAYGFSTDVPVSRRSRTAWSNADGTSLGIDIGYRAL